MIDPLRPLLVMPEVVDGSKWKTRQSMVCRSEEQFVVRAFSSVASLLFINTDHVKPDEMRHVKDLLNPKWRGKISAEDPTTTGAGANMAARLYSQIGEEFVKNLYIEQKTVRTRERRQMSDWLARGTQPICLNCREDDVRPLVKDGFKILEIFELNGIPGTINGSPWMLTLANQGAAPKSGAGVRQLDSFQGRLGDLCARVMARRPCARISMSPISTRAICRRKVSNISTIPIGNGSSAGATKTVRRLGRF